jgi:O-acetyl-ADP-ribose deacetylase (regulator of RNase III)
MIHHTRGNLLEADVEALVNTVNTVGVMGKGIALMFKEAFPDNYRRYREACDRGEVQVGRMFVSPGPSITGPEWIINFPTKKHWRSKSRMEWLRAGLEDLRRVIEEKGIRSIAIPPLGCGNGGLDWRQVLPAIEAALEGLEDVEIQVFEPTRQYQNVAKRSGVEKLTPPRALVAELVRRYGAVILEVSILEVQKLAWFLERAIEKLGLPNTLDLRFEANRYGPYAERLRHLLNALDGSYLHCERRLADARPTDAIWFEAAKRERLSLYLETDDEGRRYLGALEEADALIDGFQSPHGMELLATVDWLLEREGCEPTVAGVQEGLRSWPGEGAARRKLGIFSESQIQLALDRLTSTFGSMARSMEIHGDITEPLGEGDWEVLD